MKYRDFFYSLFVFIFLFINSIKINASVNARDPKEFVVSMQQNFGILDQHKVTDAYTIRVLSDMFEGLVEYDQDTQIVCVGAESYEISKDKKTYTFHLKKDRKWSNGDNVTAHDYAYTYARAVDPKTMNVASKNNFEYILNAKDIMNGKKDVSTLGVKAVDDYTLVIQLEKIDHIFLERICENSFFPYHKESFEKYGDKYATTPESIVSNGAYKVVSWVDSENISLEKNKYYPGDVYFNKVKYLIFKREIEYITAFVDKKIDMVTYLPIQGNNWYEKQYVDSFHSYDGLRYITMIFNCDKIDKNIRKALSMTIDTEGIINNVYVEDYPMYLVTPENTTNGYFKDAWKKYPELQWMEKSLEERAKIAKKILENAGYNKNNPLKLVITYTSQSNLIRNLVEYIQKIWHTLFKEQIECSIEEYNFQSLTNKFRKKDFQIGILGKQLTKDYPEVINFTTGNSANYVNFSNKKYDELYEQVCFTKEEFLTNLEKMLIILAENYVVRPIKSTKNTLLMNPDIKGLKLENNKLNILRSRYYYR